VPGEWEPATWAAPVMGSRRSGSSLGAPCGPCAYGCKPLSDTFTRTPLRPAVGIQGADIAANGKRAGIEEVRVGLFADDELPARQGRHGIVDPSREDPPRSNRIVL
jgi:hypothetical protein